MGQRFILFTKEYEHSHPLVSNQLRVIVNVHTKQTNNNASVFPKLRTLLHNNLCLICTVHQSLQAHEVCVSVEIKIIIMTQLQ